MKNTSFASSLHPSVNWKKHGEKEKAWHCGINGGDPAMPGRKPFMPQKALFFVLTGWILKNFLV